MDYIDNIHSWGYNGDPTQKIRKSIEDTWFCYPDCQPTDELLSFKEACIFNAIFIDASIDLPISIMSGGGYDSMAVCESFRLADIPFTVYTLQTKKNMFDIKHIIDYCKYHNIKQNIIELDILKFWKNDLAEWSKNTNCVLPDCITFQWLMDKVDGFLVLATGFPHIISMDGVGIQLKEDADYYSEKFLHVKDKPGVSFFNFPKVKMSILADPLVLSHRENKNLKNDFYRKHFPELGEREPYKIKKQSNFRKHFVSYSYTGFEPHYKSYRKYAKELCKLHKYPMNKDQKAFAFGESVYIDHDYYIDALCTQDVKKELYNLYGKTEKLKNLINR